MGACDVLQVVTIRAKLGSGLTPAPLSIASCLSWREPQSKFSWQLPNRGCLKGDITSPYEYESYYLEQSETVWFVCPGSAYSSNQRPKRINIRRLSLFIALYRHRWAQNYILCHMMRGYFSLFNPPAPAPNPFPSSSLIVLTHLPQPSHVIKYHI